MIGGVVGRVRAADERLKWVAHIAGVRREWEAKILEQIPGRRVAWAALEGVTNSGAVDFKDAGGNRTELALTLEYQPAGVVERVGDLLHVVGRQAEHDLKQFKEFIERQERSTAARYTARSTDERRQDYRFEHPFDQTNGLVDLEGESGGTADGENYSAAERRQREEHSRSLPPNPGGADVLGF
ncbi:SRPBCC family protein [Pseudarthrobacter sp. W1I19]|uniref:SRPBCC family protein n=1 Tax=Pseudarthrobacter sp. W1I19 TaxID=3042288 RepID=UPI0027D89C08|nr:SRPBCC family protein [Pseudarthrobacter sp. W1I19]